MSFAFRLPWHLLALSLCLISSVLAQSQSSSSALNASSSPDDAAVRAVVEKYFALYAAKDRDGLISLWSRQSPDYAALKQDWQREFTAETYSLSPPTISRVKVEGERASLRATAHLTAINPQSKEKREQRIVRNFAFVREGGTWKVWRAVPAEQDLAEALMKAKTEAERTGLLAEEKELVTSELVQALGSQGDRFLNQGVYPPALAIYRLAQSLAEQLGDQSGIALMLSNIGEVHRSQGEYAQALEYLQKGLALSEALGDKRVIASTLAAIGNVHSAQGNNAQALEDYQKSLALSEALGDKARIAATLNNLGLVHHEQGNYAQAMEDFQKSLAMAEALGDKLGIARTLNNIGRIYRSNGNYARALEYYQRSLALAEALGSKHGIAIIMHNIGTVHRFQGNYAQALEYYHESLAMRQALGEKDLAASTLNNMGTTYLLQGSYAQALESLQKGLAMSEAMGHKVEIAGALKSLGRVHLFQGNYAQAMEDYRKSLAIWEGMGKKDGIADTLNNIGEVYGKQGDYSQALETASRAASLARQIGDTEILRKTRLTAGNAYRALKEPAQARLAFEEAITLSETLRANVAGGEEEQQHFFESKVSPYHAMVDLLIAQGRPAEALTFAERAKARVLLDVLQTGHVNVTKAMTASEQEQERQLNNHLVSLNTRIRRETIRPQPDQARLTELKAQLQKARLDFEAFQTNLYAAHPELRAQRGEAQPLRLEEATALLPDAASALLEYVVTDDQTYLFAITKATSNAKAEVQFYALPIKRAELAKQTESFREQLAGRDLGFRASAMKLYDLLLKPAQAQLKGKTNLVIVPDEKLWDLPFQALLAQAHRFLIEEAAVSYAPSLTVLREMTKRRKPPHADPASATLLALGNPAIGQATIERATLALRDEKLTPLPEAEQEVRALGLLYGSLHSKVYTGAQAREDRVKAEAGQARILHFATHGILNNASPMYSHLVLAQGDANEDGLLEAWELMQMDLKAELAVLSACETARGRFGAGEGMIGLTWALFVAGVPSTVVSQWQVESASTRDLMVHFHRALKAQPTAEQASQTKAEALRQAALKLMKNPETSHPFYWAGFVLVGDAGEASVSHRLHARQ